jgi:hypothetical protein
MSRPKVREFANFKYVHKGQDVTKFKPEDLVGRSPTEVMQTVRDILTVGTVIYDIILTRWRKKEHLMDGAKRILACQKILEIGKDGITEILGSNHELSPSDFRYLPSKVFIDLHPQDTKAWSIILNEQRSDNEIMAWMRMKELEEAGKWEEVAELYNFNKSRFKKLAKLNNLVTPSSVIKAYHEGKMALSTVFALAGLGAKHQGYCMKVLADKSKLTGSDIKAARSARATAILAEAPKIDMSLPEPKEIHKINGHDQYIIIQPEGESSDELFAILGPIDGYHEANQQHLECGGILYRIIKISEREV